MLNPAIFDMVGYAKSRKISTELTTNGTLLQANIEKIFSSGLDIIVFGIHKKENLPLVFPQIKELIPEFCTQISFMNNSRIFSLFC